MSNLEIQEIKNLEENNKKRESENFTTLVQRCSTIFSHNDIDWGDEEPTETDTEILEFLDKNFSPVVLLEHCNDGFDIHHLTDKYTMKKALGKIISHSDIVSKELFYNEKENDLLLRIKDVLTDSKSENLKKCLQERKIAKSIAILLYGPPGTGKTETALQLARSTKRDIYAADMSAIECTAWSDLFKNIERLFRQYNELSKHYKHHKQNEPIMLLNECDSFLANRKTTDTNQHSEHTQRTNLILEAFEKFTGILIATTNLEDDIDEGFESRFQEKIELKKPCIETREKILKEKLKGLYDGDVSNIAKKYELTGREIDNVVKKALIMEMSTGNKSTEESIIQICHNEKIRNIDRSDDSKIAKQLGKIISYTDIESKELFYNEKDYESILDIKVSLENANPDKLRKYLQEKKIAKSIAILLYGPPGTGKTETALQLAKSTKRDIYVADMSTINSSEHWGLIFKNTKRVFQQYKEIAEDYKHQNKNEPIFLLNECDSFFADRKTGNNHQHAEHTQRINIILEELENFEGILMATTNLENDIDEAFDRRLTYKIKLEKPNATIREKILKEKLKGLYDGDVSNIAKEYELTGGDIDNVVKKTILKTFRLVEHTEDSIAQICRDEIFRNNTDKKVGF